ncbi:MAG: acyltransferase [Deltaproteobacteria bacterium]|nr:acyltransferase [Deltaproteobacteria bacterium]
MKVAFIQTSPEFGRIEENVESVLRNIRSPGLRGVDLIVLPELFSTGYQFKSKRECLALAERVPEGYASGKLIEAALRNKFHIVFGIAEREGGKTYNSAALAGPGGFIGVYRKAHLFCNEKKIFSPGNTPFKVYSAGKAKVGMMVCFDWFFPEAARALAVKGADIICHPSNLVLPYCPEAMVTRCIENRVFAITANRVGVENRRRGERLKFIGTSEIISPKGEIMRRASRNRVQVGVVSINPKDARDKRITPLNHIFRDRRKDMY